MTRPSRFLFRMVSFILVVLVVVALLFEPIERAFMANPGLNGLILGVLLLGIVYIFRQVLMLGREASWVELFRRRRPGISMQGNPRLLATVATALAEREGGGPIRLSPTSMRSLLDGISARLDETREISRYLIGLLIFLGLLGTFWGLLETVAAVSDVIGNLSIAGGGESSAIFRDLQDGLAAPLSGMGTAFASSLFGLAGSLILGFLDLQASQSQNVFFNELEEWLSSLTKLGTSHAGVEGEQPVPVYLEALLEQTSESVDELRRVVGRAEESRFTANRHLQTLAEKLTVLAEHMSQERDTLAAVAQRQQTLEQVLLEGRNQTGGMDEATRTHIANIELYLARLIEDLGSSRSELVHEMRSEIKLLARTISARLDERRPDRS